ncbi:FkbM family methyltransferase [Algoriphagus litoralis]|uniref:FkbM family methyltransferase n=1 Tax=Algoriphagus litoralis TaxID=2202829 RepID=UPI000DB9E9A6|nr:FkbM family methyltransferase [Algoriphagus litoralis]
MNFKKINKVIRYFKDKEKFLFERKLRQIKNLNSFLEINGSYSVEINGIRFPIHCRNQSSSDVMVIKQIFDYVEYGILSSLIKLNNIDGSIIDLGANIGLTSIYFSNLFPEKNIFSVEPDSGNFNFLMKNSENYSNIIPINKAISEFPNTKFEIQTSFRDGLDWSRTVYKSNIGSIQGITIDQLIEFYDIKKICFIKIDVEGYEKYIFESKNLNFLNLTKLISVEVHEEIVSKDFIKKILIDYGFIIFETGELIVGIKKSLY